MNGTKSMKVPDEKHSIRIEPHEGRVRVEFGGNVVAETDAALDLYEADYPPVTYIPREAVDEAVLQPSTHKTHCPYKGDASYFTLAVGEERAKNAAWSYPEPYPAVEAIREHVAFYPDKVRLK